ncbi:hypothetical protein AB1Y20_001490 [Prymnesium parvum]|uniref:Uncharacterized protein n=1 Tax=Prymnesium parvum TaxID=97485 RepID=A0AB34KDV1_PRYPA
MGLTRKTQHSRHPPVLRDGASFAARGPLEHHWHAGSSRDGTRSRTLRVARTPTMVRLRFPSFARRLSASIPQKKEPPPPVHPEKDPFKKGLPFLFQNNLTITGLVTILTVIFGYHAYLDLTAGSPVQGGEVESSAKVLPDGRVLMADGSIHKP